MTNNYGDGVAHVNIARKVVDSPDHSFWQRYIQIGSPWLPLQTVLMLPLVSNDSLWRTGAAGSIISMISFVAMSIALFSLSSSYYANVEGLSRYSLPALSVATVALNPNVVYMQATPMSELLFMAMLVISVLTLQRWLAGPTLPRLVVCAVLMSLTSLSRYEAWPVLVGAILIVGLFDSGKPINRTLHTLLFAAICATGPIYWLWHNWLIYGNALEFLTGPNSARGLYLQNRPNLGWARIFVGNPPLDLALILAAVSVCAGPVMMTVAGAGAVHCVYRLRRVLKRGAPALLLVAPFVFHAWSIFRGEIQIFPLSAFGLLNVRYGLPHLLLLSLLAPATILLLRPQLRRGALIAISVVLAAQYLLLIQQGPEQLAIYQEGYRNGVNSRSARSLSNAAEFLNTHSRNGTILMHTGALGPLVPRGGLRFADIIHEGTARWYSLSTGLPEDVVTVIVKDGDPLDRMIGTTPRLSNDIESYLVSEYEADGIRVLRRRDSASRQ